VVTLAIWEVVTPGVILTKRGMLGGRYGGRNHVCNILWLSVKGCGCGERGKFAFSHWLEVSPLQYWSHYTVWSLPRQNKIRYGAGIGRKSRFFMPHFYITTHWENGCKYFRAVFFHNGEKNRPIKWCKYILQLEGHTVERSVPPTKMFRRLTGSVNKPC